MRRKGPQAGGVVAGILIGILVLIGVLVAAAVVFGVYVAHNVRVEETHSAQGKTVRVETPVGSMRLREHANVDPKQLGLPVYPGATLARSHGKAVNLEFDFAGEGKHLDVAAAEYTTSDPASKVTEFYRQQLPHWIFTTKFNGSVEMKYSEGGYKRVIAIREEDGQTRITLAQIGEPIAN